MKVKVQDRIAFIQIDNLAGQSFGVEEAKSLEKLLKTDIRAIIWSGLPGKLWCSGGNLKYYAGLKKREDGILANRKITKALIALTEFQGPTVACLTGDVFGGGLELLSCFDHVMAAPHIYVGLWQRRIALTFGWGGGWRLKNRMGRKALLQKALTAETISAQEALRHKLVDQILPERSLDEHALKWIAVFEGLPKAPIKSLKNWDFKKESKIFEKLWLNKEHVKILQSFLKPR